MFLLLAALVNQHPSWWSDFKREYKRCELFFNVDGPGPGGDGLQFENNYQVFILSSSAKRKREPIECIGAWAKKRGLKIRYKNF